MKYLLVKIMYVVLLLMASWLYFQFKTKTRPIIDGQGNVISNSIASIESIELNGTKQWIVLRGVNQNNPVLLWIDGGPGGSEMGYTRKYLSELENDFVFVNWDQRGTGKSFGAVKDFSKLKVDDYVEDLISLSEHLKLRFGDRKIYIVGHSWGSIIGLKAAYQRPDLYEAYIGVGQQVNADTNDIVTYEIILNNATIAKDEKTISKLKEMGPPPYTDNTRTRLTFKGLEYGKYTYLFSKIYNYADTAKYDGLAMFKADEQNILDKINIIRGLVLGVDFVYPQLIGIDLEKDIPKLDLPVYFLIGREDFTTNQDMAWAYFEKLEAPLKKFYWFENSGHNNCYEDNKQFIKILREEILSK